MTTKPSEGVNDGGKPFMTIEQAEEIYMALELGVFHGTQSEAAHAVLLVQNALLTERNKTR